MNRTPKEYEGMFDPPPARFMDLEGESAGPGNNGTHPAPASRRPLPTFAIPPKGDASILLGNRYLCRGDGAILSGTSGIGKSSLSIQLAVLWGLNRHTFGIHPSSALRSLMVQSEDSDGDVAECWASVSHCLQLTAAETALAAQNVHIVTDRTSRGLTFHKALKDHIAGFKPDLVWINPLQAFLDGDITASQDLGRFLRENLNALNPSQFAYILVHHTTKPATGKDRAERLWHEVMYDMAGGAELINWARAVLSLRPAAAEGDFNLVLAKRGRRAGVTRQKEQGAGFVNEPVTTIALKHSTERITTSDGQSLPALFWESRTEVVSSDEPKRSGGRPSKYTFADYRTVFPAKDSPGLDLAKLWQALQTNGPIQKTSLHEALKRWEQEGAVEVIRPTAGPQRYRLAV